MSEDDLDKITFNPIISSYHIDFNESEINSKRLFILLDIDRIETPVVTYSKNGKKAKVGYPDKENVLFSASYKGKVRGIVTNKGGYLKNGICLYVSSSEKYSKNVHIKVLKSSMGISGAKNDEAVEEVVGYIIRRIEKIQLVIERIQKVDVSRKTLNWVKNVTKSHAVRVIKGTSFKVSNTEKLYRIRNKVMVIENGLFRETEIVNKIKVWSELSYPAGIDAEIAEFLLNKMFDYDTYNVYCMFLDILYTYDGVLKGTLKYDHLKTSMVFADLKLGFKIDLNKLYMIESDKFVVIQNDDNTGFIKIQMKHQVPDSLKHKIKINDKKSNVHTFHLYKNGRITQSSPHVVLAEKARAEFFDFIKSIRKDIETT